MNNRENLTLILIVCIGLVLCSLFLYRSDFSSEIDDSREALGRFINNVSPVALKDTVERLGSPAVPASPAFAGNPAGYPGNYPGIAGNIYPVAGTLPPQNDPIASPNAVTGATPRIIAWVNNVIQRAKPAVVGICVGDTTQSPPWLQGWEVLTPTGKRSVGSGIIVHPEGYVITNYHVVALGGNILISVFDDQAQGISPGQNYIDYPAVIIASEKKNDLALLKIVSNRTFPSIPIGNSDKTAVGDKVIAIGNPFGLTQTVTSGIVSARRTRLPIGGIVLKDVFQLDVPINPGNSGGALVNLYAEAIGINTAIYSPVDSLYTGVSFAIPMNQAKKLFGKHMNLKTKPIDPNIAKNLQQGGKLQNFMFVGANPGQQVQPPAAVKLIQPSPGEGIEELAWLGIDIVPENDASTSTSEIEVDEIEGVSPMEAGLQAGDVIKAINGYPTPNIYELKEVIKKIPLHVGQGIVLDIYRPRNGQKMYISFRLKQFDIKGR